MVRFIKGVFNIKPPKMKPKVTWNVSTVLSHIEGLGPNENLTLKVLTHKLVALLMLLALSRVHCIHAFSTDAMSDIESDTEIVFYPTVLLKHSRAKFRGDPIVYKAFPYDEKLCVVKTIKDYIARRNKLVTTDALLITYQKPHHPAHRDTVARWLKTLLCEAGIKNYTAHSYRAASSNFAHLAKIPLKDILKQGQWSTRGTTWTRFYFKDRITDDNDTNFAENILQQHCRGNSQTHTQ